MLTRIKKKKNNKITLLTWPLRLPLYTVTISLNIFITGIELVIYSGLLASLRESQCNHDHWNPENSWNFPEVVWCVELFGFYLGQQPYSHWLRIVQTVHCSEINILCNNEWAIIDLYRLVDLANSYSIYNKENL